MKLPSTFHSDRLSMRPYFSALALFLIFFFQSSFLQAQGKTHYVLSGVEVSKQAVVKNALDNFSLTQYRLVEEDREIEIVGIGKVTLISGNELKEKYDRTIHAFQVKNKAELKLDVVFTIQGGSIIPKEVKLSE